MENFKSLSLQILNCLLTGGEVDITLQDSLLSAEEYYLLKERGDGDTLYLVVDGTPTVFTTQNGAESFAALHDLDAVPCTKDEARERIAAIQDASKVKIATHMPLCLTFPVDAFVGKATRDAEDTTESATALRGVDDVRKSLDTYDTSARRKLDPGRRYENIHTMIEWLLQQNGITPEQMDRDLDLSKGCTQNFCNNIKGDPSRALLTKYLAYFGLEQYLYVYQADSTELLRYLHEHKEIDRYQIKRPTSMNVERFTLKEIVRGTDRTSNAYIYRLTLENAQRSITTIVSNPLGLSIGKEYRIDGLAELEPQKQGGSAARQHKLPSDEEMEKKLEALQDKAQRPEPAERSYEERRKDAIIGWFRKGKLDGRTAEAKYKALETEPDILDEFYKYVETGKYGKLELFGYTARMLHDKLRYDPYDAYFMLVQLRNDPKGTKQHLKYRETDPQYQKK